MDDLDARLATLDASLREVDGLLVAFSGGADSAFLLAAAARALGPDRVVAATAVSPSLAAAELPAAVSYAASLGVRHVTPATDELSREGYVANGRDRCFHCKATLLDTLRPLAAELGLAAVATGTNADDAVAGFRPGIRAAAERGALTPLLDAGLTKARRTGGVAPLGPPDRGQAGAGLPRQPHRLRRAGHPVGARPGRPRRGGPARAPGRRASTCGCATSATALARVELDPAALGRCDDAALEVVRAEGFERVTAQEFRCGSMNLRLGPAPPRASQQAEQRQPEPDREQRREERRPERRVVPAQQERHDHQQHPDDADREEQRAPDDQPGAGLVVARVPRGHRTTTARGVVAPTAPPPRQTARQTVVPAGARGPGEVEVRVVQALSQRGEPHRAPAAVGPAHLEGDAAAGLREGVRRP